MNMREKQKQTRMRHGWYHDPVTRLLLDRGADIYTRVGKYANGLLAALQSLLNWLSETRGF